MTRTLVLMRHAAAEGWSDAGDHGRHLTGNGRREAAAAGEVLRGLGIGHVLCSSATRARETLAGLGLGAPAEFMDALYECGTATMAQRIGEVGPEVQVLLVVAHAPAIPSLAGELTWRRAPREADDLQCYYPTATFTRFTLEGGWDELLTDETVRMEQVWRVGQ